MGRLRKLSKVKQFVEQLGVNPGLSHHESWAGCHSPALRQKVDVGMGVRREGMDVSSRKAAVPNILGTSGGETVTQRYWMMSPLCI